MQAALKTPHLLMQEKHELIQIIDGLLHVRLCGECSHALSQVLKTSQTHTTPVLSQLLLRMDYNQFFERTSQQRALSVRKDI